MAKETLTSLKAQVDLLTQERDANALAARNAALIANEFNNRLSKIDELLLNSPFIQKGWFKKVWWVISNWKKIVTLIEDIIVHIEDWKNYLRELVKSNTIKVEQQ